MELLVFLLAGVLTGDLGEYWVHRAQHWRWIKVEAHEQHHRENEPHGVFPEFIAYLVPAALPIVAIGSLLGWGVGGGAALAWVLGVVMRMFLSAFTHELYHHDPSLVFWIDRPVHHFHHEHDQWKCNFAFVHTFYDRLFGTFQDDDQWRPRAVTWREVLSVRWF